MSPDSEIREFLERHIQAVMQNDIAAYTETTSPDLTIYEWWITPHRIDGLPFHEYMMTEMQRRNTAFGAETGSGVAPKSAIPPRFDLANLHIQRYGDTAIASFTMLITSSTPAGVQVAAHNESRVCVKLDGKWQVVHVHKSPAWSAPHLQPEAKE